MIALLNEFLEAHLNVPVVADTGDAMFASVDIRANEIVAPAYYATMGFSIPAALGVQIVSGKRPLVLVGDGAFQMTGPEISHAPEIQVQSHHRALQQFPVGNAAGVLPGRHLQQHGPVAIRIAG